MTPELKPCPFCGGKAEVCCGQECWGHGEFVRFTEVECKDCFSKGERIYDRAIHDAKRRELTAIYAWNRRVGE